jgi:hypothetical protein
MAPPDDLDGLSHAELKGLVVKQWEQIVELQRMVAALRDEVARLKGGPGRPSLKPSGMERGSEPSGNSGKRKRPRGIRFRHFRSGSLALASLNRTCQNLVPTFPQGSLPWLLTTAACGGLRSTPDCRPRRTFLHLSYSYASPCGPALLVTQDPEQSFGPCPTLTNLVPSGVTRARKGDAHERHVGASARRNMERASRT